VGRSQDKEGMKGRNEDKEQGKEKEVRNLLTKEKERKRKKKEKQGPIKDGMKE
jgi:hypothetical protein